MAYTDDWESLMNGVFGPGGKLKFSQSTPQAAQPKPEKPEKTQDSPLPDWNAALLARQKKLDEMLKQQNAALKGQDAATTSALKTAANAAGSGRRRSAGHGHGRREARASGQL